MPQTRLFFTLHFFLALGGMGGTSSLRFGQTMPAYLLIAYAAGNQSIPSVAATHGRLRSIPQRGSLWRRVHIYVRDRSHATQVYRAKNSSCRAMYSTPAAREVQKKERNHLILLLNKPKKNFFKTKTVLTLRIPALTTAPKHHH